MPKSAKKMGGPLISPQAPQVTERQERLVTEESAQGLTPRSKGIRKLIKLIRLSFS